MATKRKFKRDYIMLEAKDMSFRYKDKVSPKAFAKIEVTDEKSIIALYAENLKYVSDGYGVVAIRNDYETIDLGIIKVNQQGKGEFTFNMGEDDIDIKGIAITQNRNVPLIGFKGNKIENYEDILFPPQYELEEDEDENEYEEYEEVEYIDVQDEGDVVDNEEDDEYEYEEVEYIEIDDEDEEDEEDNEEYEEADEYEEYEEYEEIIYEEIDDDNEYERIESIKPHNKAKTRDKIEDDYIEKKINKAKAVLGKQYTETVNKNTYSGRKNNQEYIKTAGTLLMPRQIKKGLKYFKEVKPFVSDYIDNTRWWKIEINPTTMCGYTMPYLGYINTLNYTMYSDAVMQSYKYRHYLYGVQYDEYNKRQYYIYAVPGKKVEQPDKGHTGFTRYQPCDNRNNSLGYWLCFVDCKARKILK
ncbi:MAG: hypothetical protein RSG52_06690 [Terrisporobacter sp.]|uniref:hypothetical protein n=1 Tax=Terrisporobacter sp. TaxID=1965305 RepID=UPI002FCBCEBF